MFSVDGGAHWVSKRANKDTSKLDQLWMGYYDDSHPSEVVIY